MQTPHRIAVICPTFPASTETFLGREILKLQEQAKEHLSLWAIKRPEKLCAIKEVADLAAQTQYLRPDLIGGIIAANLAAPFIAPLRWSSAFRLLVKALLHSPPANWTGLFFQFLAGIYLARRLKRDDTELLYAHFEPAGNIALFCHTMGGPPFALMLHASNDLYYGIKPLLRQKIEAAALVLTNNRYNLEYIERITYGASRGKVTCCIYNGIDPAPYMDIPPSQNWNNRPWRLLSIGSFSGVKGYPVVLKALQQLKKGGIDFQYRIIGDGDKAEEQYLRRLSDELGLSAHVEFLGFRKQSEVIENLSWCDALVMHCVIGPAGRRDGLPNALIEAMLAARPVISTYISDIPNIVKHEVNGYLSPESHVDALASLLQQIRSNAENAHAVAQTGRQTALQLFNIEKNTTDLWQQLMKTLDKTVNV